MDAVKCYKRTLIRVKLDSVTNEDYFLITQIIEIPIPRDLASQREICCGIT